MVASRSWKMPPSSLPTPPPLPQTPYVFHHEGTKHTKRRDACVQRLLHALHALHGKNPRPDPTRKRRLFSPRRPPSARRGGMPACSGAFMPFQWERRNRGPTARPMPAQVKARHERRPGSGIGNGQRAESPIPCSGAWREMEPGFQPFGCPWTNTLGVAQGWYKTGPLALHHNTRLQAPPDKNPSCNTHPFLPSCLPKKTPARPFLPSCLPKKTRRALRASAPLCEAKSPAPIRDASHRTAQRGKTNLDEGECMVSWVEVSVQISKKPPVQAEIFSRLGAHPNGMKSFSPELRGTSYPGWIPDPSINPEWVASKRTGE